MGKYIDRKFSITEMAKLNYFLHCIIENEPVEYWTKLNNWWYEIKRHASLDNKFTLVYCEFTTKFLREYMRSRNCSCCGTWLSSAPLWLFQQCGRICGINIDNVSNCGSNLAANMGHPKAKEHLWDMKSSRQNGSTSTLYTSHLTENSL